MLGQDVQMTACLDIETARVSADHVQDELVRIQAWHGVCQQGLQVEYA